MQKLHPVSRSIKAEVTITKAKVITKRQTPFISGKLFRAAGKDDPDSAINFLRPGEDDTGSSGGEAERSVGERKDVTGRQ